MSTSMSVYRTIYFLFVSYWSRSYKKNYLIHIKGKSTSFFSCHVQQLHTVKYSLWFRFSTLELNLLYELDPSKTIFCLQKIKCGPYGFMTLCKKNYYYFLHCLRLLDATLSLLCWITSATLSTLDHPYITAIFPFRHQTHFSFLLFFFPLPKSILFYLILFF